MTCVKCQREIEAESSYCRHCGADVRNPASARRLVRLPDDGRVAGVCAGLAAYFDGYSIAGDRLAALPCPAWLLTSEDDPVIPASGFRGLRLPRAAMLDIVPWGGHCGFIENLRLDGFAERWMADRMVHAAQA